MEGRPRRRHLGLLAVVGLLAPLAATGVLPAAAQPQPAPRATPRLVDLRTRFGLPPSGHSWDIDVGHVDGDGIRDLVISDHTSVHVWRNAQPGLEQVAEIPLGDPHGCAIADVDGNGLGDVYCSRGAYVGTGARPNQLYLQTAPGTFEDAAAEYGVVDPFGRGRHVAFGNLDHVGGPDLFVGNEPHRSDDRVSRNRVFVSGTAPPMDEWRLGAHTTSQGAICAQLIDADGDGWQDVLLCGGRDQGLHHSLPTGVHLLLSRPAAVGRRFVDRPLPHGLDTSQVRSALLVRLNGDRVPDLVAVTDHVLAIVPGRPGGRFGPAVAVRRLAAGTWVTAGQVDGRRGPDLFVVQGCTSEGNAGDLLLRHRHGFRFDPVIAPRARGCGDTAATLDLTGDGRAEVIVGNGRWAAKGPYQVLTLRGLS